jgi:hypothetical protein
MLGDFRSKDSLIGEGGASDSEQEETNGKRKPLLANRRKKNEDISGVGDDEEYSSLVLCSQYDQMSLERVLGKKRCDHMLQSNKSTFLFF